MQPTAVSNCDTIQRDHLPSPVAVRRINPVFRVGRPGLQKTRVVRQVLGDAACWIEGHATAFGMYCQLWQCQGLPVVIDDVDSLYSDRQVMRFLKCLCQTEPRKRVAWYSKAAVLQREGIPHEFYTTSKVLIIANDWRTLNQNVAALEDRGHVELQLLDNFPVVGIQIGSGFVLFKGQFPVPRILQLKPQ